MRIVPFTFSNGVRPASDRVACSVWDYLLVPTAGAELFPIEFVGSSTIG